MLILTKESIIVVKMFNKNILRTLSALALISPIGIVGVNILGVNIGANETISIFGNGIDVAVSDQSLDLIPNLIYLGIASIVLSLLTTSATDYFFAEHKGHSPTYSEKVDERKRNYLPHRVMYEVVKEFDEKVEQVNSTPLVVP